MRRRQTSIRALTLSAIVVTLVTVGACGGPSDSLEPYVSSGGPNDRLSRLVEMDQRVARVSQRLLVANVDLCPVTRDSAGWALHAANQYSPQLRPFAVERFGLLGNLPGVLAAPEESPAAQAGLRQGDLILSVNALRLTPGDPGARPEFEGLASNVQLLDLALSQGPARLGIRRSGEDIETTVVPRKACGYEVQLNPSDDLNARADGRRLYISTALTGFAVNDDELALILGHELAHHVLRHRSWSDVGGAGREANDATAINGAGDKETQADRVGLFLAARAGYDTRLAPAFWRRFGAANWRVRYPQLRHASAEARARALEQVQVEIDAKRAEGGDLLP